jgi:hypothetical protein
MAAENKTFVCSSLRSEGRGIRKNMDARRSTCQTIVLSPQSVASGYRARQQVGGNPTYARGVQLLRLDQSEQVIVASDRRARKLRKQLEDIVALGRSSCRQESRMPVQATTTRRFGDGVRTVKRGQLFSGRLGQKLAQPHLDGGGFRRRAGCDHGPRDQILIKIERRAHAYDCAHWICACKAHLFPRRDRPEESV